MQAVAGDVAERLGHERRRHAGVVGEHVDHVPEEDRPVGRGDGVGVVEVALELAVAVLVVVGVVAPPELVHVPGQRREEVPHPGQALDLVTGLGRAVERVGDLQAAVGGAAQQRVLGLDPGLEDPAALLAHLLEQPLQDDARGVGPGLAVDLRIAVQHSDARLPRHPGVGRGVGEHREVGVGRALADVTGGEAREARAAVHQHVQARPRYRLRARLAVHVDEHRQEELDAVLVRPCGQVVPSVTHANSFVVSGQCCRTCCRARSSVRGSRTCRRGGPGPWPPPRWSAPPGPRAPGCAGAPCRRPGPASAPRA